MPGFFFKGVVIGFSIAAPVGPIGLLCIRRTLAEGRWFGLATGLGAALADACYGCVAAFGLTTISSILVGQQWWLGVLGGAFLCFLGVRTIFSRPAENPAVAGGAGLCAACIATFFLTITNPLTILAFVAVFAGLGLGTSPDRASAFSLVVGVFLGSGLWWLLLTGGVALLRTRIQKNRMRVINRCSGAMILGYGLYSLATANWN